jgi:hypothetical protein
MLHALASLRHLSDRCEGIWYHDLGHGKQTSDALLARGLVKGDAMPCTTRGCVHPGYLLLTEKGRAVLAEHEDPGKQAIALLKRIAYSRPLSGKLARQKAREFLAGIGVRGE